MTRERDGYVEGLTFGVIAQATGRALAKVQKYAHAFSGQNDRNLRISVAHAVNLVANGMTPAQVVEELPDLQEEDVRQAIGYAAALAQAKMHPAPIDGYNRSQWTSSFSRASQTLKPSLPVAESATSHGSGAVWEGLLEEDEGHRPDQVAEWQDSACGDSLV